MVGQPGAAPSLELETTASAPLVEPLLVEPPVPEVPVQEVLVVLEGRVVLVVLVVHALREPVLFAA